MIHSDVCSWCEVPLERHEGIEPGTLHKAGEEMVFYRRDQEPLVFAGSCWNEWRSLERQERLARAQGADWPFLAGVAGALLFCAAVWASVGIVAIGWASR